MDSEAKLIIHPKEGTPDLIDTPEELAAACKLLKKSTAPVAIDVERAGGYRYSNRAYLIQIRREDVGTFLIDSAALPDLASLNQPLSNAVWILHDADQDIASLRLAGLEIPELFDTMLAARLLGLQRFGLAAVCEQFLGLTLDKNHQNDDWSTRPLPRAWLRYAALDVELLTDLYRAMSKKLYANNRWEWAVEEFANILTRPVKPADPQRWRTIPGAGKIKIRRNLAILEELWTTREKIAQEIDIEPTRLISNKLLVELALQPPRNTRQFLNNQQLRRPRTRKYLDQWMAAISRGKSRLEAKLPDLRRPYSPGQFPKVTAWKSTDPDAHTRLQHIRTHVKNLAAKLEIDQEILLDTRIQRHIAWHNIRYQGSDLTAFLRRHGARQWQIEFIFKDLARAIKTMPA
ncbi:HRDC domain-containing protein [Gleimia sp. 6138-11-ORH1]|uniref:ribonuclease D n=1 Tax=Gleimia sp. 6138-11-ORH1 TaxID=2973937 RepID=UPI002168B970|nr:HRDC domain-containing protein [Gleimia sp. 6138-11-ORH1]MCS4484421.1 HRDC domain-containing protein [Gleimia sp. 6138-11-ORH1]